MKKIILSLAVITLFFGCKPTSTAVSTEKSEVVINIDLNKVIEDKLLVTVNAPTITTDQVVYHLPKIIPGTYSEDDYGKFIEEVKAFDTQGNALPVEKLSTNSWTINQAKKLNKITYWVNDTYDVEKGSGFGSGIFSPAGTNILDGKNFMLNNHGFIGYFENKKDIPHKLTITHSEKLYGATSLVDSDSSNLSDTFVVSRYNDLVDNPIMYCNPDYISFNVDGMEIILSVYSPTGKHTAKALTADLEKCMRAQKKFLGTINNNKKYAVLLYLSEMNKTDAKGFGALEHSSSTTVVFPEMMSTEALGKQIIDVVSHEFFHIVTPLGVHSNEIHYFDFESPKMSQHLWMYEGVTEYFANLFQVNQGLISEEAFYKRMDDKINGAKRMNDTMSFTTMSKNVLIEPYKSQYLNVYEKGALIGMCIDIIIREKSNGQRGVLDMMQKLTQEFGPSKPFNDNELFARITEITYPEVGEFLNTHVAGNQPIPYENYFAKVGIAKGKIKKPINPFQNSSKSVGISGNSKTKEIVVRNNTELSPFMIQIGLKADDIITSLNDKNINLDNLSEMMKTAQSWKEGENISITIIRNGKEQTLSGKAIISYQDSEGYQIVNPSKQSLKEAWLKR